MLLQVEVLTQAAAGKNEIMKNNFRILQNCTCSVNSIVASAPPSCQPLWYPYTAKRRYDCITEGLSSGDSTVLCEGCKALISNCRSLYSTASRIYMSYFKFCVISTLHTAAFDNTLTRVLGAASSTKTP